jgi:hypothetical protein
MAKKTITKNERLQLVGLLALATKHNAFIGALKDAAYEITGEEDDCGHTSDAIYSDYSADELLRKLEIKVKG